MQVAGQAGLRYCYDGASRLTKIVQPGSLLTVCSAASGAVNVTYDGAGRRNVVTLPNTDTVSYGYDYSSRISSMQYQPGAHGLTYTYDAAGNRIQIGSDWARTGLPAAMSSAAYDPADELQTWNGAALPSGAFDANGNLQSDGTKSYSWNKRNQLTGITGGITASFTYDAFGRRTGNTIGGVTTNFVYDGLNPVQELVGGTVTANLLTGLGIDEVFRRSTISGGTTTNRSFFPDALGSTIALTDDDTNLQTQYRYEPFGQESLVSGSPSDSNPYQFTGRENDSVCQGGTNAGKSCASNADCPGTGGTCVSTGLYYYRARYYNPTWGRFVSEEPLDQSVDGNLYVYVSDDPLMWTDPLGLYRLCGFSPPQAALMESAIAEAKQTLSTTRCAGAWTGSLLSELDAATYVYDPHMTDTHCGEMGFSDFLHRRVKIGPRAFVGCCKLPATVLHEVSHLLLFTDLENGPMSAYKVERQCFNCP